LNRASLLAEDGRAAQGLAEFDRLIRLAPLWPAAHNGRAAALGLLGRHADASVAYAELLRLDPGFDYAPGLQLLAKLQCCDWSDHAVTVERLLSGIRAGKRVATPGLTLGISSQAAMQLQAARTGSADRAMAPRSRPRMETVRQRICVAWLSADFGNHPVSLLLAGVFESFDRERFEVVAVSLKPSDGSSMRRRLEEGFDRFIEASHLSDAEVAATLAEMKVDIAIDLMGHTSGCRPGILARQPVPVTVNYLGFPGTMGSGDIDYLIADRVVVPDEMLAHYAEHVVRMPDVFQANDDKRRASERLPTRAEAGLPPDGFVYCCFNNHHKYNPVVFDVWMRLLAKSPGSTLWLYADNETVRTNLAAEAAHRGIDPARLVFASRVPYEDHLARLPLADLFLDTWPFNAGTTASDSLWSGVPVLTLAGEAFASRMGASLLRAVGLSELVTQCAEDYESIAVDLAARPGACAAISAGLLRARSEAALFDTRRFSRHLESAFETMWRRQVNGDAPAGFDVVPIAVR
jgi:predicted O-linked N-acetylglucosamine transferase (SPINDLY family)